MDLQTVVTHEMRVMDAFKDVQFIRYTANGPMIVGL
jgi:hypothetical protein